MSAGAKEDDYEASEESSRVSSEKPAQTESSNAKRELEAAVAGQEERKTSDIGSISFVSCATGEDAMTRLGDQQESEEGILRVNPFCLFLLIFQFFFRCFRGQDKAHKRNSR